MSYLHCIPPNLPHIILTHRSTSKLWNLATILMMLAFWKISKIFYPWIPWIDSFFLRHWISISLRENISRLNSLRPETSDACVVQVAMFSKCWYSGLGFNVPIELIQQNHSMDIRRYTECHLKHGYKEILLQCKDMNWYDGWEWRSMEIHSV